MSWFLRMVAFFLIVSGVFNGLWLFIVPLLLWYVIRYDAYELMVAAFCIDVYFATGPQQFFYTFAAAGVVLGAIALRPLVRYQ